MPESFDPYRKWLGIPPKDQPPNHYRLLGIAHFEDDPDVIENAASRQMAHVRTFQGGKHSADSQRILNELTAAKLCLLQPDKKSAYDAVLRDQLESTGQLSSTGVLDAPVEEAEEYPPAPPNDFRPAGKRWRTGTDIEPPVVSAGPAPVPIPMPPSPAGPIISPGVGAPVIRRGGTSVSRGRKSSSGGPLLVIVACLGLLAVAVVVVVMMAMKPPSSSNQVKTKTIPQDKSSERLPPKSNVANSSLPANESRPPRLGPRPPRTERVNNRDLNPSPPTVLAEPQDELKLAREALARRNDGDFTLHISQAEYLIAQKKPANAAELEADGAHLREVNKVLSQFWQAVRDGADKKIPKGERFQFRKHEVELVRREGEQLTYKFDGREEVAAIKKLPARVAIAIAYRAFGNDDLSGKIALVMFLTIDADAASDQASKRLAIKLLGDIQKAGEENHPVLTRELGKDLKPMPLPEDDFSPPTIVSGASPSPATPPNGTPASPSSAAFDPMRLKEAREKFERRFRERLVMAAEHLQLAKPLFTELIEAAAADETPEFKVQLLNNANELAARLGDSDGIVKLSEQIGKLTGENPLEIQLRLFSRCSLEGPTAAKDLLKNAQAASAQAQAADNLYAAIELAKIAKRAAEKTGSAVETNRVEGRLEELEVLQEKKRTEKK
jgi:hypothetical protein